MKPKTVVINNESFEVHDNGNEVIPYRLYQPDRRKTYWAFDTMVAKYTVCDFYGTKLVEIEKEKLDNAGYLQEVDNQVPGTVTISASGGVYSFPLTSGGSTPFEVKTYMEVSDLKTGKIVARIELEDCVVNDLNTIH